MIFINVRTPLSLKEYRKIRNKSKKKRILGPTTEHQFLLIIDVLSHYLYGCEIKGDVNETNLRNSFDQLFREGLPRFMVKWIE